MKWKIEQGYEAFLNSEIKDLKQYLILSDKFNVELFKIIINVYKKYNNFDYLFFQLFVGQLLLDVHKERLAEIKTTNIISSPKVKTEFMIQEAFKNYEDSLKNTYSFNNMLEVRNKLIPNNSYAQDYVYKNDHQYGSTLIFCVLLEKNIVMKYQNKMKYFLEEKGFNENNFNDLKTKKKYEHYIGSIFDKNLTFGALLNIGIFKKNVNNDFYKILDVLFNKEKLNIRNNLMHCNFSNYDCYHLTFTATLLQLLFYVLNNEILDIKEFDYILEKESK